jgi:hypothetical protein
MNLNPLCLQLVFQNLLYLANSPLDFPTYSFTLALGFQLGIICRSSDLLFNFALHLVSLAFHRVLCTWLHIFVLLTKKCQRFIAFRDVQYDFWRLLPRDALLGDDDHTPCGHGVLPFRGSQLRGALRLPCGGGLRVHGAQRLCDDAGQFLLPMESSHQFKYSTAPSLSSSTASFAIP